MKHLPSLILIGAFSTMPPATMADEPKGVIARSYEDGRPVIFKLVDELPPDATREKLQWLAVISWKYDGADNNGMPLEQVNKRMIALEDAIESNLERDGFLRHAYSRTGNDLKEFVYYINDRDSFSRAFNEALGASGTPTFPFPPTLWCSHMKALLYLTTLLIAASASAEPTCSHVSGDLVGINLGQIRNYPDGLKKGIIREGTAEFVADAGFESLEGKADSIVYRRIMAFFDRGSFTSVTAVGSIRRERDHGYARILQRVAALANTTYSTSQEGDIFACETGIELSVKLMKWDGKDQVSVQVKDTGASRRAGEYINAYCSDPDKRRPQDACK